MKNISIVKSNNKINRNLPYYSDTYNVSVYPKELSVYKYYYSINKQIDYFFINTSTINNEIGSFIKEFSKTIKIILICDNNTNIIKEYTDHIHLAIGVENLDHKLYKQYNRFIINDKLYSNLTACDGKKDQLVYFLDNDMVIPQTLQNNLYPNTKSVIKMFNGNSIVHPQHLGYIDENDRKNLLLESKFYLFNNTDYIVEAQLCGCLCIDIKDDLNIENIAPNIESYATYGDLLKDILC